MQFDNISDDIPHDEARPWIVLKTTYDVEAWIEQFNRDLQRRNAQKSSANTQTSGHGICFCLIHGGEIFMHTTSEGEILLDVTEEATWIGPVLTATTGQETPPSTIWSIPGNRLTQLLLGLSSLIASTRSVLQHDYKIKKRF